MTSGPTQGRVCVVGRTNILLAWESHTAVNSLAKHDQRFLNLFAVSMHPMCLPQHHPCSSPSPETPSPRFILRLPGPSQPSPATPTPQHNNLHHLHVFHHWLSQTFCTLLSFVQIIPTACRGRKAHCISFLATPGSRPVETMGFGFLTHFVSCFSCLTSE